MRIGYTKELRGEVAGRAIAATGGMAATRGMAARRGKAARHGSAKTRDMAATLVLAAALIVASVGDAAAQGVVASPAAQDEAAQIPFTMNLSSRVQVRYTYVDPDGGDAQGSFGIRRGRLAVAGDAYDHFNYAVQLELAGGSARLIDANIRMPLAGGASLWVGQGKAHFGRQQLTSSGRQQFVDRTVVDGRFTPGRQQGVAVTGRALDRSVEYAVGVYNGNGINNSNDNSKYLTAGRVVWTPLGSFSLAESALDRPGSPRLALGVAGLHNTLGNGDEETDITRFGTEGAFKLQGWSVVGELFNERAEQNGSSADTRGWYAQLGYLLPGNRHEIAGRIAAIQPKGLDADVIETGIAYSYYMRGHNAKIQADFRQVERKALDTKDPELRMQMQLTM